MLWFSGLLSLTFSGLLPWFVGPGLSSYYIGSLLEVTNMKYV